MRLDKGKYNKCRRCKHCNKITTNHTIDVFASCENPNKVALHGGGLCVSRKDCEKCMHFEEHMIIEDELTKYLCENYYNILPGAQRE